MNKYEICKDVAENGYRKINVVTSEGKNKKVILDSLTANLIKQVFEHFINKSDAEMLAKLESYNWLQLQNIAFKILNKRAG